MPPRPSARASNGSASVSGSAGIGRGVAQGVDRHASPSGVSPSNQTLDPELRRHKLREAFLRPLEPARRSVALRAEGSARGAKGWAGRLTRRTGRPGGGGRIRDERVGVREQRDGAPFRDGARGGDREVRVGRGGVRSSPRAVARLSAALAEFTGARRRRRIRTVAFARDHATRRRTPLHLPRGHVRARARARARAKCPGKRRRSRPWW